MNATMEKAIGKNGQCRSVALHQQPPTSLPNHKAVTRRSYAFHLHNANGFFAGLEVGAPLASAEVMNVE